MKQHGFTLLELLIVVAIVGIMAGFALLSIPGSDFNDELEREARKVSAQISLLQDEAIVQSRELGVKFWANGYRFWAWQNDTGWLPLTEDADFKPHVLPVDSELSLSLSGQPVSLSFIPIKGFPAAKIKERRAEEDNTPDFRHNLPPVLLFSSGEATPFEVELRHPDAQQRWKLQSDIIGQLKISSEVVIE